MRTILLTVKLLILQIAFITLFSQSKASPLPGVAFAPMKKYYGEMQRKVLDLPTIDGYELVKADLHMHTIFSDGYVWPVTRVEEAFLEGIDAISITDHLEYVPLQQYLKAEDHNLPYEIAKKRADELGIILIRGAEITREVPAGHFNAIFIQDANKIAELANPDKPSDGSNVKLALQEAVNQGGFVFFNHPWNQQPNNEANWHPIHEELYRAGLIMGVEVNNRDRYYPNIFQWCNDKSLTMMSTTDAHSPLFRLEADTYRSMNILLVKERTQNGIREALDNRRAIVYTQNYLYGKEEYLKPIFHNSLKINVIHKTEKGFIIEFKNASSLPFEIELFENPLYKVQQSRFIIESKGNAVLFITGVDMANVKQCLLNGKVLNCHVNPETPMEFKLEFNL